MFYLTKQYSSRVVYIVYETVDGKRLGIQTYNIFGSPGMNN
jgi:hypothetical protein